MRPIFRRPRFWLLAFIVVLAGAVLVSFVWQRRVSLRDMLQVQTGMSTLEVDKILGRADIVELADDQVHWLFRGSPGPLEERRPGETFYWVVVFDADGKELGWDDESRYDNSVLGSLERRLNRRLGR